MTSAEPRWKASDGPSSAAADSETKHAPTAFLSYAWESDDHMTWVEKLARRLQAASGVKIILDQWDLAPGSDRFLFMEKSVANSDFVIVVCSPAYTGSANDRVGGVGYESMVITSELATKIQTKKFIPVLRVGEWNSSVPIYLRSKHGVDLRNDPYSETQYDLLIRAIHGEPIKAPPLGAKPAFAAKTSEAPTASAKILERPPLAQGPSSDNATWSVDDGGPCIEVIITNSRDVIEAGRAIGLEYPEPLRMRALIDTGAAVTVISKAFAKYCKLFQTGESKIRALGGEHSCGEHAGAISFPGTNLQPIDAIRLLSADFVQERNYAILIGRDILKNWTVTFDGRNKRITIVD